MPPKKKITDYAKPKTSKKAKKAEDLPSADGGASENEAWVAGSQEPTKGDLNKMYSRQGKINQAGFDQLTEKHTSLHWPWRMK